MFMDRPAVQQAVGVANVRALNRGGGKVRTISRRSIKRRKSRSISSPKGSPPYAHTQGKGIKTILYGYDRRSESVVIGFARLSGTNDPDAPSTLEQGGTATITVRRNVKRGQKRRGKAKRQRSAAQLARIKQYYEQRNGGGPEKRTVRISKRPTMAPALATAQSELSELWRDQVKGSPTFG